MLHFNKLMNELLTAKLVQIANNEIEDFVSYCNEHEVYPQGGAYTMDKKSGKVTAQYFYI